MKKNSDRLLKILIVLATLIILGTLATLAFLNFSAEEKRNDRSETTTSARLVTSSTNATSTTEESSSSSSSVTSKTPAVTTASRSTAVSATTATVSRTTENKDQPSESVNTQRKLTLEEAINENANEERGERVTTSGSKSFDTQAEAHEYALAEMNRISKEERKPASYVVKAVRDSAGKVVSWEVEITVE